MLDKDAAMLFAGALPHSRAPFPWGAVAGGNGGHYYATETYLNFSQHATAP